MESSRKGTAPTKEGSKRRGEKEAAEKESERVRASRERMSERARASECGPRSVGMSASAEQREAGGLQGTLE